MVNVVAMLSWSRISPTSRTSGSSRSAERRARGNDSVSLPTSRWLTAERWLPCTYSMGSSMVTMWQAPVAVDVVDHGGQGGRLPRPGRAGDDHQPHGQVDQALDGRRDAELVEPGDLVGDDAQGHGARVALVEGVAAQAGLVAPAEGEVDLALLLGTSPPGRRP